MKISFNWLKEYIDSDLSPEEIAKYLTNCGLEVESIEHFDSIKGGLKGLLIGEIITSVPHENSDHLHVTTVDIGKAELINIVCGASNVKVGQKVVVATVGAVLYNENESFTIKKCKIRGVDSEGMICAEDEAGLGKSHAGIMVLENNAKVGTPAADYFKISSDYIFEIGLTPNRNDAISHFGVAKNLYAVLTTNNIPATLKTPVVRNFIASTSSNEINIFIENKKDCPRYTGLYISNVEIKDSPEWLKNRLISIGVRPINVVVDVTQFVMFELGQPLHAFDADLISGNKVIVKNLPEETPFVTLDGNKILLSKDDLMICNSQEGMCIAGVYGGIHSGITANTKNVFLESAYFNPVSIRKTAKRHHISTDASYRYERGCDPDITVMAIKRAANLIQELTNATITGEVQDVYSQIIEPVKITLNLDDVTKIVGKKIELQKISDILLLLGMETFHFNENTLLVTLPLLKLDSFDKENLIAEILRIYGYNNIETLNEIKYHLSPSRQSKNRCKNIISSYLADNGFFEIVNNSITNIKYSVDFPSVTDETRVVKILNPLSNELDILRQSLLFGGLDTIAYNINNKNQNLRFFEFGRSYNKNANTEIAKDVVDKYEEKDNLAIWVTGQDAEVQWNHFPIKLDVYYLKNILNNIFDKIYINISDINVCEIKDAPFSQAVCYKYGDNTIAKAGIIHPQILKKLEIKKEVCYAECDFGLLKELFSNQKLSSKLSKEISPYPAVRRDLSLIVDKNITYQQMEDMAYKNASKLLKSVSLFDVYEGESIGNDKKSYALNFVLQHSEKTLTEDEINAVINRLITAYKSELNAILRD